MKDKLQKKIKNNIIANNLMYYEQLESTQKLAKQLASKSVANGTTIITNYQIAGIGTHERIWYSNPNDNITFTQIFYPKCNVSKLDGLTYKIAEIIVNVLKVLYDCEVEIKKPNDLIINDKKVGGILTETKLKGEIVEQLFIGIGLNVHQKEFSKEIANIATSLEKEYKTTFSREDIIAKILDEVYLQIDLLE